MCRKKLKGEALRVAIEKSNRRRMDACKYGAYNDYRICTDCGAMLDPSEKCSCI